MKCWPCDLRLQRYDLDLGILVDTAVSEVLMPKWLICACRLPMRGRCAKGMESWSCDLRLQSHDLDLGILVNAAVSKVLMPAWPICACGLPMRVRWNFGAVTFDLGAMTLTLEFLWKLLCPRYWWQCGQSLPVNYPWRIGAYGHFLVFWISKRHSGIKMCSPQNVLQVSMDVLKYTEPVVTLKLCHQGLRGWAKSGINICFKQSCKIWN